MFAAHPSLAKGMSLYQDRVVNDNVWRMKLPDQAHAQGSPSVLISANARNWRPDFLPMEKRLHLSQIAPATLKSGLVTSDGMNCGQLTSLHGVAGTALVTRQSPRCV
jgi:hypothetical protein